MDFVAGETLARRLLRDAEYAPARAALPGQLAAALAAIHALDPRAPALAFLPRPPADATPAAAELARHEQLYRAVTLDPHPALELALRWLAAAPPAPRAETLVHGDFRIGNVIFGPEGLRAVLDWELAHVGDPMEDLGWLCVRERLDAVRAFPEEDVVPALEGPRQFHARVAANVLAIVGRELAGEEASLLAEWRRLAAVLGEDASAPPARLEALRAAVREG